MAAVVRLALFEPFPPLIGCGRRAGHVGRNRQERRDGEAVVGDRTLR